MIQTAKVLRSLTEVRGQVAGLLADLRASKEAMGRLEAELARRPGWTPAFLDSPDAAEAWAMGRRARNLRVVIGEGGLELRLERFIDANVCPDPVSDLDLPWRDHAWVTEWQRGWTYQDRLERGVVTIP